MEGPRPVLPRHGAERWLFGGGVLPLQLMAVVDRMKQAGVPLVLVGAALPRTGGGTYGAAAFLEDPSGAEMLQCQERSVTITSAFNQKLQSE